LTTEELKKRTREFAVRVMRLVDELPKKMSARAVGSQLVRCATSVGANYQYCLSRPVEEGVCCQDRGCSRGVR